LECTEVYLDDRAYFEHAGSYDWMGAYPEIVKAVRSLKPTTYCLGHPSEEIWTVLESYLKAIRFTDNQTPLISQLRPGLFFPSTDHSSSHTTNFMFIEIDVEVTPQLIGDFRNQLTAIQEELSALYLIIIPTNLDEEKEMELVEVRITLSFPYFTGLKSPTLGKLEQYCAQLHARVITFDSQFSTESSTEQTPGQCAEVTELFLQQSGVTQEKFTFWDGHKASQEFQLAGYPIHPLFRELIKDETFHYKSNK